MNESQGDAVVIVGAGQAGVQVAASLREAGYTGSIDVVGAEDEVPYQRPPLSKAVLAGKQERDVTFLRPAQYYLDNAITVHRACSVEEVDRSAHRVRLSTGETLPYTHLVLATGAAPRRLPVPGADLDGVLYLRDLADADVIKQQLAAGADRIVIIGGGFIGLEAAATLAGLGRTVTVLETAGALMPRVASDIVARYFATLHEQLGNRLLLNTTAVEILGADGKVTGVRTGDGEELPADLVLVGIGVLPRTELAERIGLDVDGGIVVGEHLQTTDPAIFAIGDCAFFPSEFAGGAHVRLESVQNATDQARHVAATIAGTGAATRRYSAPPWFWTDQGSAKYQIAGIPAPHDNSVVIGSLEDGKFSVLLFRGDELVCVESVGKPIDHINARKMITLPHGLTPAQARADGFELKAFVAGLA